MKYGAKISHEDALRMEQVKKPVQAFFSVILLFMFLFLAWAYFGTLDVVSITQGLVASASGVQHIQHLEGGILKEVLVKEGEAIHRDQPLIVLESTGSSADVKELRLRHAALHFDIVRMEAELANKDELIIPPELSRDFPDMAKGVVEQFKARRRALTSEVEVLKGEVEQKRQDIELLTSRLANTKKSQALLAEQIAISDKLTSKQLMSRFEQLGLLREASNLKTRIQEDESLLNKARESLLLGEGQLERVRDARIRETRENLESSRRQWFELTERLNKYEDSLRRTVIRSPMDGVVKTIHLSTVGGVVRAGMTIMEIVPEKGLIIESNLPPQEVGFVQIGQKAFVQLASAVGARLGKLHGEVVGVSPDTLTGPDGRAFYKVRIKIDQEYLEKNGFRYTLRPGVTVMAGIVTGNRSILDYLMGSLQQSWGFTMNER